MDTKVISTGIRYSSLLEGYVRPESERPKLSEVEDCEKVPIIDLGCGDRSLIVQQIGDACEQCGFFQVINHGVSMEAVNKMLEVANEFFSLQVVQNSDDPSKTMRDYCKEVRELGFRLQEAISESLGLDKDHIKNVLVEQRQHMAVNYYPPCPDPELTYGLPGHMDPNAFTILLQDLQVASLKVLKDGHDEGNVPLNLVLPEIRRGSSEELKQIARMKKLLWCWFAKVKVRKFWFHFLSLLVWLLGARFLMLATKFGPFWLFLLGFFLSALAKVCSHFRKLVISCVRLIMLLSILFFQAYTKVSFDAIKQIGSRRRLLCCGSLKLLQVPLMP